jgi:hypothetical protein
MIEVYDINTDTIRAALPGEGVRFQDGTLYVAGMRGELRLIEPARPSVKPKHLSPAKLKRKQARAEALQAERSLKIERNRPSVEQDL